MPDKFDMPKSGPWEERGGWVVRALMRDLGLTLNQAAGLVGNLGYESAGFTKLQEIKPLVAGSRGGFGYAQWTGPRREQFELWAADNKLALDSDAANYGFLLHELRGQYRWFLDRLARVKTLADASRLTHELYETPADVLDRSYRSGDDRLRYAQRALAGAQKFDDAAAPIDEVDAALAVLESAAVPAQVALQKHGFYRGAIDGDWGPQSRTAMLAYRKLRSR